MNPFTASFWEAVGVAAACGAMIGVERQMRGKPAGIRTSMLICLGTTVFVRLGMEVGAASGVDPTRVLAQVVTGVGFIGAGVMLAREGLVRGVTSAAVIWTLAAIGSMVGLGHYAAAVVTALIVLAVLTGVQYLEQGVRLLRRGDYARETEDSSTDQG
jgi:putative Mg2+ transporter-C (MgtC) family protein